MNTLPVPGTSLSISRVGFGCGRLYASSETLRSSRLIEAVLAAGVTHFDTAPYYGEGGSEQVLGDVLRGIPGATVTTKIGLGRPAAPATPSPMRRLYRSVGKPMLAAMPGVKSALLGMRRRAPAPAEGPPRRPFPRDTLRREVELSLKALQRDRIDVLLVHEPDQFDLTDADRAAFEALVAQGMVGAFGTGCDRIVADEPPFGTVLQSRFDFAGVQPFAGLRIYHGLMRHRAGTTQSPAAFFAGTVAKNPGAAFLFSASTPAQVHQVAAALDPS